MNFAIFFWKKEHLLNIPALVAVSGIKYLQLIHNFGLVSLKEMIGKIIEQIIIIIYFIVFINISILFLY